MTTGYGPTLPVTSGGLGAFGLVWGISSQNLIAIAIGILAIGMTLYFFARLRQSESKLNQQEQKTT